MLSNFHEVSSTATYYQMQEKLHGYTGVSCTICIQVGPRKLSTIRSSGVSAIQGLLLSIEVNGRKVGTFKIVPYIALVSTVEGCLFVQEHSASSSLR